MNSTLKKETAFLVAICLVANFLVIAPWMGYAISATISLALALTSLSILHTTRLRKFGSIAYHITQVVLFLIVELFILSELQTSYYQHPLGLLIIFIQMLTSLLTLTVLVLSNIPYSRTIFIHPHQSLQTISHKTGRPMLSLAAAIGLSIVLSIILNLTPYSGFIWNNTAITHFFNWDIWATMSAIAFLTLIITGAINTYKENV